MVNNTNKKYLELKKLITLEDRRTVLAAQKKYKQLRATYKLRRIASSNKNSGPFWDTIFSSHTHAENFVEQDRNRTAYRWLLSLLRPQMRVLNIACGDGKFESYFEREKFQAVEYEGVDFAAASIKKLRKKFPAFHFWVGDITKESFKKKYDVLCAFEILEHLHDVKVFPVLKKMYGALKHGGYLMVAVPLNEPLLDMFPSNPNEHVRHYSRELICAELEITGFTIVKVEEFIAFASNYQLKKLLSRTILQTKWKPNDILVLAQKN